MRRINCAFVGLALLCCHAFASEPETSTTMSNQQMAAMVEWMMANCSPVELPGMAVMMASMIANGSTPAQMDEARTWFRTKTAELYGEDKVAACAAFEGSFKVGSGD